MSPFRVSRPGFLAVSAATMFLAGCGFQPNAPAGAAKHAVESLEEIVVVDPKNEAVPETEDLVVSEPSPSEPVKAAMKVLPSSAQAGEAVELLVAVRIAGAHYLHAQDEAIGPFTPLQLEMKLPEGVSAIGDWKFPPPEKGRAGQAIYRNKLILKRSLKVATTLPTQTLVLVTKLRYQACNDELCWPPNQIELSAPLVIRPQSTVLSQPR